MGKKSNVEQKQPAGSSNQKFLDCSVIFLLGPTAVGKTDLSFYLSEKFSASILNCDSIQMYKGLDIGSAKPVLEEKEQEYIFFFLTNGSLLLPVRQGYSGKKLCLFWNKSCLIVLY